MCNRIEKGVCVGMSQVITADTSVSDALLSREGAAAVLARHGLEHPASVTSAGDTIESVAVMCDVSPVQLLDELNALPPMSFEGE